VTATRDTWPCPHCDHKHYPSQQCADHAWTDYCPYEGLDCPPDVLARKAAAEAEIAVFFGDNPDLDLLLPPPID
jgi:hypothetical protein